MQEIILGVLAVLGSAGAWKFYENRAKAKQLADDWIKMDCQKRISKLEKLLEEASDEKNELRKQILELTGMVAELRTKVDFLEREKKSRKKDRTNAD
jgi:septal ring factor EnvC (AmiA/AmiB activator)